MMITRSPEIRIKIPGQIDWSWGICNMAQLCPKDFFVGNVLALGHIDNKGGKENKRTENTQPILTV